MEERILKFITALRNSGVRISLAESADAFKAVEALGVKDRNVFRISLRSTLVKEAQYIPIYEELFPLFFGGGGNTPLLNAASDLTPEEAAMLAQALRDLNRRVGEMVERLMRGGKLSQEELERLAKMVGLTQADDLRYREWMVQRLKKALRFREVREALQQLAKTLGQLGMDKKRVEQLQQALQANQQALENQLRQYAGQRIAENMSQQPPQSPLDKLMNQSFSSLTEKDMEVLRREVRRLATVLRTRVSLRQKRAKSGQLDAKATIRANLKHGNVPLHIIHRNRKLKPKLVVVCDISTSMRSCSELMLSFIYELQDQISKTRTFAFIDHLEYISPDFAGRQANTAVRYVLKRMPSGYYNTDFGYSLENFVGQHLDTVDRRTTLLIVGDGRNNYNDPRLDLFRKLARRSKRTLWITPEPSTLWGTGDSDMLEYAPDCDMILQAGTLAELTVALDHLLTSS